jgi:hypothetical protein
MEILKVQPQGRETFVKTDAGTFTIDEFNFIHGRNVMSGARHEVTPTQYWAVCDNGKPTGAWRYAPGGQYFVKDVWRQLPSEEWSANLSRILTAAQEAGHGNW